MLLNVYMHTIHAILDAVPCTNSYTTYFVDKNSEHMCTHVMHLCTEAHVTEYQLSLSLSLSPSLSLPLSLSPSPATSPSSSPSPTLSLSLSLSLSLYPSSPSPTLFLSLSLPLPLPFLFLSLSYSLSLSLSRSLSPCLCRMRTYRESESLDPEASSRLNPSGLSVGTHAIHAGRSATTIVAITGCSLDDALSRMQGRP